MYLYRDNKIEFEGNKKEIISYIREAYVDEYFVEEFGSIFQKDFDKFIYVCECLGIEVKSRRIK